MSLYCPMRRNYVRKMESANAATEQCRANMLHALLAQKQPHRWQVLASDSGTRHFQSTWPSTAHAKPAQQAQRPSQNFMRCGRSCALSVKRAAR